MKCGILMLVFVVVLLSAMQSLIGRLLQAE